MKSWARMLQMLVRTALLAATLCSVQPAFGSTGTNLADQPVFAGADVPGNLALTLSVEFPTAISDAHLNDYADGSTYLGYFDPAKCYQYVYNSTTPASSYFQPRAFASSVHQCGSSTSARWSGNFLNWATMQTIDPFRWALSGGFRSVDTTSMTVIEKAWSSNQGALANFPFRGTAQGTGNNLATGLVSAVSPFTAGYLNSSVWTRGNMLVFSTGSSANGVSSAYQNDNSTLSDWTDDTATPSDTQGYRIYVRVRVCDPTTSLGVAGVESNCVKYGNNYKPEGLLQQYSGKIRYSVFSYLNQDGNSRQGGVLREPMGYIGPTYQLPLSANPVSNGRAEWDSGTGIQSVNPDTSLGGTQSGVMNYLNKFGESGQTYMTYDDVSELYYAAVRYYENLGNVPEWTNNATTAQLDGFPAVTSWADPMLYACQKNFILGIGDDHTWYDYNVGGGTLTGGRAKPSSVASDTINQAHTWTAALQTLEGITPNDTWPFDSGATYYIAGLAYGVHVNDIRSDLTGTQTISTYWMDVMEDQEAENLNPYYLATKYGGFNVPSGYTTANTTPLDPSLWNTSGANIIMNGGQTHGQPDNYFLAGNPSAMVSGLASAFSKIANAIKAYATAFSLSSPVVTTSGNLSFSSQYDSSGWTGVVTANSFSFAADGTPSSTTLWTTSTTLQTQLAGTGWQTGRNIITYNGSAGIAFEPGTLSSTQLSALTPSSYSSSTTSTQYVNYLRGDRTNEVGSTASASTKSLRARTLLLGDIVDATLTSVAAPSQTYSDATNAGYSAFVAANSSRPTMVYAGANDGMLHAFVGTSGTEQFAYVPSAMYQGPDGTPQVDGLAALGNPNYGHHYYVDATPLAFDVDFGKTGGTTGTPNWHTVLIGGLGKGGTSFYALDISDPASMSSESTAAGKVLWEFTDSTMGYSFGAPVVVKTAKYGWVVIFTSGYNNSGSLGYIYLVNPKTGALLQKIPTASASNGLAQAQAYVMNYSDYSSDSVYAGDLNGKLWRFDLTGTPSSYPSGALLATLADASGNAQPITTAPLIEIHPTTRQRYVMVGTGRLLASSDISSSGAQSFYAILDGSASGFSAITLPITRANLTQVTDITVGISPSIGSDGWYYDLGSTGGVGYRVVLNPRAYNGVVTFASLLTTGDACSPSGSSRVYAVNYLTGTSVISATQTGTSTSTGAVAPYVSFGNAVTDLRFVVLNGSAEILAGLSTGETDKIYSSLSSTNATRLLNWRELPTPY